jgi:hypothetical protein
LTIVPARGAVVDFGVIIVPRAPSRMAHRTASAAFRRIAFVDIVRAIVRAGRGVVRPPGGGRARAPTIATRWVYVARGSSRGTRGSRCAEYGARHITTRARPVRARRGLARARRATRDARSSVRARRPRAARALEDVGRGARVRCGARID